MLLKGTVKNGLYLFDLSLIAHDAKLQSFGNEPSIFLSGNNTKSSRENIHDPKDHLEVFMAKKRNKLKCRIGIKD